MLDFKKYIYLVTLLEQYKVVCDVYPFVNLGPVHEFQFQGYVITLLDHINTK